MEAITIKPGQIYGLTIVLDADYLADPKTAYPIRIDPTVELVYTDNNPNTIEEKTLQSNNTTSGSNTATVIGLNAKGISRTIMKFPGMNFSTLNGVTVESAVVTIRDLMCESEEMTITCYPFTGSAWTESDAQWANLTQSWGAALDYNVVSYANGVQQETAHRYSFDITALAQQWVDETADEDLGIIFRSPDAVENGTEYFYKTFATSERASYKPTFEITYRDAFSLNYDSVDVSKGGSVNLIVTSILEITGEITWESSDPGVATVSGSGVVTALNAGETIITASGVDVDGNPRFDTCTVYVKIPDGTYCIANASSGFCLANYDSTVNSNAIRLAQQNTSTVTQPTQFWDITYIDNGWYSIRSVDRPQAVLTVNVLNKVVVKDLAANVAVEEDDCWKIVGNSFGYALQHSGLASATMTPTAASTLGSGLTTADWTPNQNCHWNLVSAKGVVLYDTTLGRAVTSATTKYLELGQSYSLADIGISWKYYGSLIGGQEWSGNDYSTASVHPSSGQLTAKDFGTAVVTIRTTLAGISYSASYAVNVVLSSGNYFLGNKTTGMYADIEHKIIQNGQTIQQWEFHGGNTQKWTFTHIGNGIYTIHSQKNAGRYYLGVSEDSTAINQPIVLRTGSITDGMKWKIEITGSGAFKLTPKTGIANNYVLATSTSDATNGATLIQGAYFENESYRDEWYIRPVVFAASIGGEFHGGQDVIDAANNWIECGYSSTYDISPSVDSLDFQTLNSEIVYFSSHGDQHFLTLYNDILLTDWNSTDSTNSVSICDFSLPNARLFIYDACLTASNLDETGHNLCTETLAAGVDCVIGWQEAIGVADARAWQARFQQKLYEGQSVLDAANYASTFSYQYNESIKSWLIYGNQDLVVNLHNVATPVSTRTVSDQTLKNTNIEYRNYDEIMLKSILSDTFQEFDDGEANITITYTNAECTNYVIDYMYLYCGYITQSGYTVIVEDGTITYMRDNTFSVMENICVARTSTSNVTPELTVACVQSAIAQANEEVLALDASYIITQQTADKFYNVETGKFYYRIMSVYKTTAGSYGTNITLYEL